MFSTKELADNYSKELTIVTKEAEWVEIRMFDLHSEDSIIMTPVQEDMYWENVIDSRKDYYYTPDGFDLMYLQKKH